jgi:putative IMPACT (imprinted ancient) family translation regulator
MDYSFLSKLQYEISKRDYIIDNIEYLEDVTMKVLTAASLENAFIEDIAQWTNGSIAVEYLGEQMLKVDEASGTIMK